LAVDIAFNTPGNPDDNFAGRLYRAMQDPVNPEISVRTDFAFDAGAFADHVDDRKFTDDSFCHLSLGFAGCFIFYNSSRKI
jgi:hypothetical protein